MPEASELMQELSADYQQQFQHKQVILSFGAFLDRMAKDPEKLIRSAVTYLKDTFDHFGKDTMGASGQTVDHFHLFDMGTEKSGPIIGCETVQDEVYKTLDSFERQGYSNKLVLLHGPNGSAKTSSIEAVAHAMQRYSETEDGAVYTFNWIFPSDKSANPTSKGEAAPIGFGNYDTSESKNRDSFAHLDEAKIASKIRSEFRDNPIYLLPMPQREQMLRRWIAAKNNISEEKVELPPHALISGLSKKNQMIVENLLAAYDGDLSKVFRHVQVERFFYSRQYRVGIATVEPQMSIDAREQQLTMDNNIQNLPAILHNMRFHEVHGQVVEANRGILEFSDMLKRPVEAYKYLLTTVEKGTLSLPSSTAHLDIVFFGTTNEKHLDAFKTIPDFTSFRSRFELVTVPYLLEARREARIYEADVAALKKSIPIAPHALEMICVWAVMTRLKQPDPEHYEAKHRTLVARLDPRSKVRLYEGESLQPAFKASEESVLRELRDRIYQESQGVAIYEGRFGASPREVRGILHRAAQSPKHKTLTPMAVFDELRRLVRDKTVYEFLQFEPRGKYHDAEKFIEVVEQDFAELFEHEILMSMTLVEDDQYDAHLKKYIDHVVAFVKKERIYHSATSSHEAPSNSLMNEVEKIIGVTGSIDRHRQNVLGRVAAYKIDNPGKSIEITEVFQDYLRKIQDHYYSERKKVVEDNFRAMHALGQGEEKNLTKDEVELAKTTFSELQSRFGYDEESARQSLRFLMNHKKTRK